MASQARVASRAVVERNYAILPPEGIPESLLPEWTATAARVLTAPAMGAEFVEYLLDLAATGGSKQTLGTQIEAFFYVLEGRARLELGGKAHDLAMNIFTFPPGYSLPMTETHIMEHGLYFLQGQGDYYLGDTWREVQAGDFIWMGPYCPQGFLATGSEPARYIYYKNVNRDVEL